MWNPERENHVYVRTRHPTNPLLTHRAAAPNSAPASGSGRKSTSTSKEPQLHPPCATESKGTRTAHVLPQKCDRGMQTEDVGISAKDSLVHVPSLIPLPPTVVPRPYRPVPLSMADVDKEHEARVEAERQWQQRMEEVELKHAELIKTHMERLAAL